MNKYLLHGKLTARQGHREALADILIDASKLVATAQGCKQKGKKLSFLGEQVSELILKAMRKTLCVTLK